MRLGVVFPQTEIGSDPKDVRRFVEAVESAGYDHLATYDHVLGADISKRPNWRGPYNSETAFHEVFVLFGFCAGFTEKLELASSIIILPQRQTALVAKQAAEIDVLTNGRFRLGVGLGWNDVEYTGLNENFKNRGKRIEEQIEVLRKLWTDPVITFEGKWHHIDAAGILPMPVQRPIPVWMGGISEAALRRAARIADGWFPQGSVLQGAGDLVDQFRAWVKEADRDPADVGIEGRIQYGDGDWSRWRAELQAWKDRKASHASMVTMNAGLTTPDQHIEAVKRFIDVAKGVLEG